MTKYFAKDTPLAELEYIMMAVPGFRPRGSGIVHSGHFHYKAEDVDCRNCRYYDRGACQVHVCPYVAERLETGAIGYRDLVLECFGTVLHPGLQRRIRAVVHWDGPDRAALNRIESWWQNTLGYRRLDTFPGWLATLYLLASREILWEMTVPALAFDTIDFYKIAINGFDIHNYPIFYAAKRLYNHKTPMNIEGLADSELIDEQAFLDIIYATLFAQYGPAIIQKRQEVNR